MATAEQDTMASVERRRIELEENVAKLRKSLQHWENWGIEYEMLKEEIQNANDPSPAQISQIGRDLGGKLVNENEVDDFLGKGQSTKRTANQIVDMISRRVDYVQQNITTVEKQLDTAEKKLSGVSVLLEPDMENEEGLPWMDIEEELDEEENVISGKTSQPGKAAPELVEILRKTGIKKAELEGLEDKKVPNSEPSPSTIPVSNTNGSTANSRNAEATTPKPKSTTPKATPSKKSVSFAEDTKSEATKPAAPPRPVYAMPAPEPKPALPTRKTGTLETAGYNEALADYNFTRGTKVVELDDDDNEIASYPIIPQDETPESAELRRQMLQYGLSEVGAVVAEIDLERPTVEYSGDEDEDIDGDYDDDYDNYEDSELEEEEDKFGRTTKRVVTDDYKKQMMELEKKLNARMMENVGPREDSHPLAEHADDVRSLKILKDEAVDDLLKNADSSGSNTDSKKKGVRFANNLDVSPAPSPVNVSVETIEPPVARKPTMADSIVERSGTAPQPPTAKPSKPAKVSRFKSGKASSAKSPMDMLPVQPLPESQQFPTGPSGQIVANEVIEKTTQPSDHKAPDEFDPIIVNRQIQAEYHKLRNTMINRQGGFMPDEDEKEDPLMEEKNGKMKKVSRFMAARLKSEDL
jgi:unconventional prefoldin RPB5 interactor 1